jgi:hypothetical protein
MYEEDWSILMLIYFCMHLILLLANLLFFSKVIYFLKDQMATREGGSE